MGLRATGSYASHTFTFAFAFCSELAGIALTITAFSQLLMRAAQQCGVLTGETEPTSAEQLQVPKLSC